MMNNLQKIYENKFSEELLDLYYADGARLYLVDLTYTEYMLNTLRLPAKTEKRKSIILYLASFFKRKAVKDIKVARQIVRDNSGRFVPKRVIRALINAADLPFNLKEATDLSLTDKNKAGYLIKKLGKDKLLKMIGVTNEGNFYTIKHEETSITGYYDQWEDSIVIDDFRIHDYEYEVFKRKIQQLNVITTMSIVFSLQSYKDATELAWQMVEELDTIFLDIKIDGVSKIDKVFSEKQLDEARRLELNDPNTIKRFVKKLGPAKLFEMIGIKFTGDVNMDMDIAGYPRGFYIIEHGDSRIAGFLSDKAFFLEITIDSVIIHNDADFEVISKKLDTLKVALDVILEQSKTIKFHHPNPTKFYIDIRGDQQTIDYVDKLVKLHKFSGYHINGHDYSHELTEAKMVKIQSKKDVLRFIKRLGPKPVLDMMDIKRQNIPDTRDDEQQRYTFQQGSFTIEVDGYTLTGDASREHTKMIEISIEMWGDMKKDLPEDVIIKFSEKLMLLYWVIYYSNPYRFLPKFQFLYNSTKEWEYLKKNSEFLNYFKSNYEKFINT